MENINYVNAVMTEINDLTDCIYESLVDADYKEMKLTIQNLIKVLRDLDKTPNRERFIEEARSIYEKTLDSDFQSFNGFNVSVKDEDVEIPISFNVAEDERLAMKNDLTDFDSDSYFENRWFSEDGKPKVQQIMADKYLLENREKIFSKIANEAASQRLLAHLKKNGNININQSPTPQGAKPDLNGTEAERLRMAEWAFSS
jgi:hypothetical protein